MECQGSSKPALERKKGKEMSKTDKKIQADNAFKQFDLDRDGYITKEEFKGCIQESDGWMDFNQKNLTRCI